MSIVSKALKDLGHSISSAAEKDLEEIVKHPGYLAGLLAGPEGPMILAELHRRGAIKGHVGGTVGKLFGGGKRITKPSGTKNNKDIAAQLAGSVTGECGGGVMPWVWQSTIPVGTSAITKRTSIGDFMAKANASWFGNDNTFPLPFQSSCVYGFVGGKGAVATKENVAQLGGLYVEMKVASVIAQYALLDMGVRIVKEDVVTTSGGGYAGFVDRPEPVEWEQFFDPKAQYYWNLYSNVTYTPVAATDFLLAMPGAVVNGAGS